METHKEIPILHFKTVSEWESWLIKYSDTVSAIWMKFAKKKSGESSISYEEAVEAALCYGWIDGLLNPYDEKYYLLRFTPRGPKSVWSKVNKERIKRLIAGGRMQSAGLAKVDAAKADGRWEAAYGSPKGTEMPKEFLEELKKNKKAQDFFATLNKSNKYAIAWQIQTAVKEETRLKRIKKYIEMMERGEKLN